MVYDYYIKDHLGNTRMTLTEEETTSTYLATMEIEYREFETSDSQGLGFRNITSSNTEVNPTANTTTDQFNELNSPSPNMVLRTNGSYSNLKIGASKMIKVMTNDVVSISARATTGSVEDGGNASSITAALVSQAFGGGASSTGGAEGAIFNLFNNNFTSIITYFGAQDGNATDAYLNWILFDENFDLVDSGTGFDQVSDNAIKETLSSGNISVASSGYFYVFVSNEGTETVYFDDVRLEHTRGTILQEDHYYPFGLNISALSSTAPLSKPNTFDTFQGQERTEDFDLGWIQFKWRNHDPTIARFFNVDPLADKYLYNSPYAFSENRVTDGVELEGLEYVRIVHTQKATGGTDKNVTAYYRMSSSQVTAAGGTPASGSNAAAYGPGGKGVQHVFRDSNGNVTGETWEQSQGSFAERTGTHGLYSGAGSITKSGSGGKDYDFGQQPIDIADAIAKQHDIDYTNEAGTNYQGFVEDVRTLGADRNMLWRVDGVLGGLNAGQLGIDTPFNTSMTSETRSALNSQKIFIGMLVDYKTWKSGQENNGAGISVTNKGDARAYIKAGANWRERQIRRFTVEILRAAQSETNN